ncbi:MAG TPA: VIT family protein [Candidatus Nanopelagicaceae bacterium]|jgi:vacuolar iron transporter family protein|nr:VIT family protein [Candidatus Nanopelagicaceae bacterium]
MGLAEIHRRNEDHRAHRAGWLRAAVLGVNDGLVSTASLMIGVVSAQKNDFVVTAGLAGIAAGAMSMAVGEYVSVRSQNDIEESDKKLEMEHLAIDPQGELEELTQIYQERGISRATAEKVAQELHAHDALGAHLRDELGQHDSTKARPMQAALASAISFTAGGAIPLLGALAPSLGQKAFSIIGITFIGLIIAGIISAKTAGSSIIRTTGRIVFGGALGMAITALVGQVAHISGI